MFEKDTVFDEKYLIEGVCCESGGMGSLLFVTPVKSKTTQQLVLKYCKIEDEEIRNRFRREVRLMTQFAGNTRVMQIIDYNLESEPPYFVMPYFENGDLTQISNSLKTDVAAQEDIFNQMIDCISELHLNGIYHRDIKPHNFLRKDNLLVVSDLGISYEINSPTGFTQSSIFLGTREYLPPEFLASDGFRTAEATSDIFMLGKTFYNLLTERDPTYLSAENIPSPIFVVIERCCTIDKKGRYQTLAALRQSLTSAYDVVLGRVIGSSLAIVTLREIMDKLQSTSQFATADVHKFIEQLAMLDLNDAHQLCMELPEELFNLLAQPTIQTHINRFLNVYRDMVENATYAWSFAETVARNMKQLFESTHTAPIVKAEALEIAIVSAYKQNRFAAMETCQRMITTIIDDELGQRVREVLIRNPRYFISSIQLSNCKSAAIKDAIIQINKPPPSSTESFDDEIIF